MILISLFTLESFGLMKSDNEQKRKIVIEIIDLEEERKDNKFVS